MREDAQLTFDKTNTEGLTLVERKLRIQWAETKVKQNRSDTNDKKSHRRRYDHNRESIGSVKIP
ncbi:hypothetical protein APHAL10511_004182 [Amanita phalloides]|nr:hypothetical protein APHAL10511_004182 [Amanita phalloides]